MMLLFLVIVAVEITSFTWPVFLSCGSIVFFLQHKKSQQKKKLWTKKGTKSVCDPLLLNAPGVVLPLSLYLQFLTRHRSWGCSLSFCKMLKSGVCTICAALLVWDRHKLNQESIVFRDCFIRNIDNLVPYVINHLSPPLPRPLKCC